MRPATGGFRVAVIGSASLLGKELIAVLNERRFPVSKLVTPDVLADSEPDLPVLDLSGEPEDVIIETNIAEADLDFVFVAGLLPSGPKKAGAETGGLSFLESAGQLASATHCKVIDLRQSLAGEAGGVLNIPSLDRRLGLGGGRKDEVAPRFFISPHPATIVISTLLLRLTSRVPVESAVAHVFGAVSEIGSQAIEELQKQTMNLLTFQKIPQAVFGTQLAFNLLPRFGRGRKALLANLETRIQKELTDYLGQRAPSPALRFIQVPVFHSLACSLFVQLAQPATAEALTQALAGDPIHVRKASELPPSQVEVSGSSEILVDAITPDPTDSARIWVWAVADNLRLAAVNAVEIAEGISGQIRPKIQ
jgi:aspartate-semialdehyde dehydrogenase